MNPLCGYTRPEARHGAKKNFGFLVTRNGNGIGDTNCHTMPEPRYALLGRVALLAALLFFATPMIMRAGSTRHVFVFWSLERRAEGFFEWGLQKEGLHVLEVGYNRTMSAPQVRLFSCPTVSFFYPKDCCHLPVDINLFFFSPPPPAYHKDVRLRLRLHSRHSQPRHLQHRRLPHHALLLLPPRFAKTAPEEQQQ